MSDTDLQDALDVDIAERIKALPRKERQAYLLLQLKKLRQAYQDEISNKRMLETIVSLQQSLLTAHEVTIDIAKIGIAERAKTSQDT